MILFVCLLVEFISCRKPFFPFHNLFSFANLFLTRHMATNRGRKYTGKKEGVAQNSDMHYSKCQETISFSAY